MNDLAGEETQRIVDREHLKFLAIAYYVLGATSAVFSSFGLIHLAFGMAMILFPHAFEGPPGQSGPPLFAGYFFSLLGGTFVICGWTFGGLTAYAGRCIQLRKHRVFTLVMALLNCANCLFMPLGAIVCVFSFMVLTRTSVTRLYDA